MPNLINTDSAGNVFYNYFTPVINGVDSRFYYSSNLKSGFLDQAYGAQYSAVATQYGALRLPAPDIETKTGQVTITSGGYPPYPTTNARFQFSLDRQTNGVIVNNNTNVVFGSYSRDLSRNIAKTFICAGLYSLVLAEFDINVTSCINFHYWGFLREPVYIDSVFPLGAVYVGRWNTTYVGGRALGLTSTTTKLCSTTADSITSPPIVCTTGTDPGDGSETFTDIVIRDADSPNNPVGKLWNCIDMPATCNVGELWKNTGAYDADDSASEQDVYLCVMPWGTRKLGMRVWTENVV